jgi:hypothetical protein
VLVEPPRPGVLARRARRLTASVSPRSSLRLGASAAVVAMAAAATGDVLLAGVLLGVAVGDAVTGAAAVLAGAAVVVRWDSSSLAAVGGNQAVLGWAGSVGPVLAAASTWLAALAVVLSGRREWPAIAAGALLAALLVAGPTDAAGWWIRLAATAVAGALTFVADRVLPRRAAVTISLAAAAAAVVSAVMA